MTFYASGAGLPFDYSFDGSITGLDLSPPFLPVRVSFEELEAEILYAGSAPDLVSGLFQFNVQVPPNAPNYQAVFWLQAGDATSESVLLAVE